MCRLAIFNTEWLNLVTLEELSTLFTTLDTRAGGHGMGIALCYEKNAPVVYKGVDMEAEELAEIIYAEKDNIDLRYILFHTRMMTSGTLSDDMCHPFSEQTRYGLTLAHNGVVRSLNDSTTHSDTRILFDLITKYGIPLSKLRDSTGVFIGVYKRIPFVVKPSEYTDLSLAYTPDNKAWCFCSSFYEHVQILSDRFIVEQNLGEFSWTKKLMVGDINKMVRHSYAYKQTTNKTGTNLTPLYKQPEVDYVAGYGDVKTRVIGEVHSYHDYACVDWYCDGECLEIEEKS